MRVTVKIGYDLFIGELTAAEVEMLQRIGGKLCKVEERHMTAEQLGQEDSDYAYIMPEGREVRPHFKMMVPDQDARVFTSAEYDRRKLDYPNS